ncbi:hypothetical protein K652_16027 [Pseudomonas aeruginosa VRFPA02]|nr:hypothetical protein K652_16027 [Pseudomonas aeruginosa VRFPA02]
MNGSGHEATSTPPRRSHWRWLRRLLTLAFFVLVPVLLFLLVKNLDWQEVRHALGEYRPATLFLGLLLAAAGYTVFSSFDLLSRYYIGHSLPKRRVFTVAFVCNAFNLNLSSWVGAVALRYRLYSRLGLDIADITRILTFSLVTNWFGYLLLAGILFSCGLPALPPGWKLGSDGLRLIGALLLALRPTPRLGLARASADPAVLAAGGPARPARSEQLVADGAPAVQPAAAQRGLPERPGDPPDQQHRRGHHPYPGRARGARSGVHRPAPGAPVPGRAAGRVDRLPGAVFPPTPGAGLRGLPAVGAPGNPPAPQTAPPAPGPGLNQPAGRSSSVPSGGRSSTRDCAWPWAPHDSLETRPWLPAPEPANAWASLLSSTSQSPPCGTPIR